jgi:hypothetical protein
MAQEHDDYGEPGDRPRRSSLRRMAVGIVLLLAAYVASYAALLDPGELAEGGLERMNVCRVPAYRVGGEYAYAFYRPALWVDQRVRPGYWDWRVDPPDLP